MNKQLTREDIEKLTVDQRLQLIEDVWATLELASDCLPVPEWHTTVLDERLDALESGRSAGAPWHEVRSRILRNS